MAAIAEMIRAMHAAGASVDFIIEAVDAFERAPPSRYAEASGLQQAAPQPSPQCKTWSDEKDVSVYVMATACGLVKIGISKHPAWRAAELSSSRFGTHSVEYACRMPSRRAAFDAEQAARRRIKVCRRSGEYFKIDLWAAIEVVRAACGRACRRDA